MAEEQVKTTEGPGASRDEFAKEFLGNLDDVKFMVDDEPLPEPEPEEKPSDTKPEPEDVKPPDTKVDTGEAEDLKKLMAELGLTGQYKTEADVIRAAKAQRDELNRRDNELLEARLTIAKQNELLSGKKKEEPTTLSDDDIAELFQSDPVAALKAYDAKRGYVSRDEVDTKLKTVDSSVSELQATRMMESVVSTIASHEELVDVAAFVKTHGQKVPDGLNPRWDAMNGVARRFPRMFQNAPLDEAIDLAFELTKPAVTRAPVIDKKSNPARTTTNARRSQGNDSEAWPPLGWEKMSDDEILAAAKRTGHYQD